MSVVPQDASIDTGQLRAALASAVRTSPLDFIRRIDADGDRTLFLDRLTAPLPPDDDLRFLYHGASGTNIAVLAQRLDWDSNFFGYGVARIDGLYPLNAPASQGDYLSAVTTLIEYASARQMTYLFATVEARDVATLRALGEAGFAVIETRLYYHRELENYSFDQRFPVRVATAADVALLCEAARDTVNPFDRFHADPFITRAQADRMMVKWVEASILEGFADLTLVPDAAAPRAFCTLRYHKDHWERWGIRLTQPVFSAVAPEFKGWYKKLISEISYHLKSESAQHAYMTTQSTNSAVLWTWESLGYRYGKSEHILRKILRNPRESRSE
jgi:dTDP-4-amino-4,6-dideoxy-D-galactose acyltransferase